MAGAIGNWLVHGKHETKATRCGLCGIEVLALCDIGDDEVTNRIVRATLEGMQSAFNDHYRYSRFSEDGEQRPAHRSPEYMFTVYIAQQIMRLRNAPYVDIESPVARTVADAGGWGPGAVPDDARREGTFDIALSNRIGPFAVVEVKVRHAMTSQVEGDVIRICRILNRGNNIRCGLLALLVSGQSKNANREITYGHRQKRVSTLKKRAQKLVEGYGRNLRVTCRESVLIVDEQKEYAAMAFGIHS